MSNLVDKAIELQVMTCLDSLLDRANHDEYLGRIGKKEALKFLEENRQYAEIIKLRLHRLESIDNAKPSEALKKLEMLSDCAEAMKEAPSSNWIEYADNETELDYQLWRAYEDLKSALLKAQKEHNSINLLMQELDCKDFAELRKYARCGYQTFRNAKGANYDNIIIDEAQESKKYLKWEDLEFDEKGQIIKVILNGSKYKVAYFTDGITEYVDLLTDGEKLEIIGRYVDANSHEKHFFNDLHLERVEE